MTIIEIRELSDSDLESKLEDSYRDLMNLRFRIATRQIQNVHLPKATRKDIARIKTVMTERGIGKTS
jgi:large subunit ribosomal protein L29